MMRSLFSGVAGLKVHQTRMDVIGNNIANVNTTSYKSQSMVFSDLLYQTTQAASGANAATGRGGINARQIGLGAKTGAISTAITTQGSAQSTNNPFDIMITGEAFFVVSNGSENFFTRDGSFTVDGAGNLVMSSTGYTVMGWQTDKATGEIIPDTVSALKVMSAENLTYPPEATTKAYVSGIMDKHDSAANSTQGKIMTLNFFDKLGYTYTAKFSIHATDEEGNYKVRLDDILDSEGDSLVKKFNLNSISDIASFGETKTTTTESLYNILNNVTYDDTEKKYSQVLSGDEVLEGFKDNSMIKLADKWQIDATVGSDVATGSDVSVSGTVTLDKNTLQGEPFNLIFEEDAANPGTYKYYYQAADPSNDAPVKGAEVTDWVDALESLKVTGIDGTPTVDAEGNLTINFKQTFKATRDSKVQSSSSFSSDITALEAFGLEETDDTKYTIDFTSQDGKSAQIIKTVTQTGNDLVFDTEKGTFEYVGTVNNNSVTMDFSGAATSKTGEAIDLSMFSDVDIDFSLSSMYNNGGTSTIGATNGDKDGYETGRKLGEMIGIEVGQDGKITASYDNGQSKLLGQISVATFANASGLSKQGDNLYSATMNSGEFDGIGQDITAGGAGYMTSGVLEMSNVDLSSEFTEMITTQRGFQANSRIITTSDSMLEELVNLKR